MRFFLFGLTFATTAAINRTTTGNVLFEDNFSTFDLRTWKHDLTLAGGGNWEFQRYVNNRTSSYVSDGKLTIRPTFTLDAVAEGPLDVWGLTPASACTSNMFYGCQRQNTHGNPITSAKITTSESFSFKYGRLEVSAKIPRGDWLWPAIWLLPKYEQYGGWPQSGEIDILEATGNAANYIDGADHLGVDASSSALHWGMDFQQNRFPLTVGRKAFAYGLCDSFHTYGLVWNERELYTYVDDDSNKVLHVDFANESFYEKGKPWFGQHNPWASSPNKHAPFDQEFILLLIWQWVASVDSFQTESVVNHGVIKVPMLPENFGPESRNGNNHGGTTIPHCKLTGFVLRINK